MPFERTNAIVIVVVNYYVDDVSLVRYKKIFLRVPRVRIPIVGKPFRNASVVIRGHHNVIFIIVTP